MLLLQALLLTRCWTANKKVAKYILHKKKPHLLDTKVAAFRNCVHCALNSANSTQITEHYTLGTPCTDKKINNRSSKG